MDLTPFLAAAGGVDSTKRNQAEAAMKEMEKSNPGAYLFSLVQVLVDGSKEPGMRQLAGIMMKNALCAQDDSLNSQKRERWLEQDGALRNQIKQFLFTALGADDVLPRSAAAQVIAKVGGIEMEAGQWPDLVGLLLGFAGNPAIPTGGLHAVLMAIGYLLEEIEPSSLTLSQIDQILGCFVVGLSADKPVEIQQVSASSMVSALPFAESNFQDDKKEQRDHIMTAICNSTQVADMKVRLSAFDCIILVASLYYQRIQPYMEALFQITVSSVSREEPIAIRAIEFWNTICEVEIGIANGDVDGESRNYAKAAVGALVPLLTSCMAKQPEEYDEQVTPSMAASMCLALIAQATEDDCLGKVAEFIGPAFDSPDWHFREAAVMAIGSIMEGPSEEKITPFIRHFSPMIVDKLTVVGGNWKESQVSVRDTCAWALGKIILNHITLVEPVVLEKIVEVAVLALKDEPRVVVNACYCLNVLSSELAANGQHHLLSPRLPSIIKALGDAQARDEWDECNLRDVCWVAIGELLKNTTDTDIPFVQMMLTHTITMLNSSIEKPLTSIDDRNEQFSLQACLCGAIQTITNRLEAGVEVYADQIMTVLHRLFNLEGATAIEDGLMAVSALANHAGTKFLTYLDALHPILLKSLKEHDNFNICVAGAIALGDICRAVGPAVLRYSDFYVAAAVDNLGNRDLNSIVKPPLIGLFGDLAIAAGAEFKRYVVVCFKLLSGASKATADPEDEDDMEMLSELRVAILEAYTGIAQGFAPASPECALMIVPQLPELAQFAATICGEIAATGGDAYNLGRNPQLIKLVMGVLGDLATSIPKPSWVTQFNATMPWVYQLLQWLHLVEQAEGVDPSLSLVNWAASSLRP